MARHLPNMARHLPNMARRLPNMARRLPNMVRAGAQGSSIGTDWTQIGTTGTLPINCGARLTCEKYAIPTDFVLKTGNHTFFVSQFSWQMTLTDGTGAFSDSRMTIKAGVELGQRGSLSNEGFGIW